MKKKAIRKMLLERAGGKCQMCGESNPIVLDFHHRQPKDKCFCISGAGLLQPVMVLFNEVDKTVLLCKNCHAITHHRLNEEKAGKYNHKD
jgi:5-methylcytosine-specific restriction endonuclease McrA